MTQPSPVERPPISPLLPALGGAVAAVVAVGLLWLGLRGGDDDVIADGSATTTADVSETTAPVDEGVDTTEERSTTSEGATTEVTTIDDVPLSDLPAGAPDSFVGVTNDTFELVRVESRTNEVLASLGSWTPGLAEGAEPEQALQLVELAPDGTVYVDDCCEPAYGSTFIVADAFDPDSTPRLDGLFPEVSPDGSRLARTSQGSAVAISDTGGIELGVFGVPDFAGPILTPLTWIDSSTLLVSETRVDDEVERLRFLDVSDPFDPSEISGRSDPGRSYLAADVRADGNVLVVVRRLDAESGEGDVVAEILDPSTSETVADFDLPDDVVGADYDASGRFVMTVATSGQIDWYGAGQRGTLGTGFISANW